MRKKRRSTRRKVWLVLAAVVAVAAAACSRSNRPVAPTPTPLVLRSPSPTVTESTLDSRIRLVIALARSNAALELSRLGLTEVPADVTTLVSLTKLDLSSNALTELPESIALLTNLESLNLSHNRFTAIPPILAKLPRLANLSLRENPIDPAAAIPFTAALESLSVPTLPADAGIRELLAMTSLRAVLIQKPGALPEGVPRYEEISLARAWTEDTFVAAELPGKVAGDPAGARAFFAPATARFVLHSDEAFYRPDRPAPCHGLSLGLMRGIEPPAMRVRLVNACEFLYVHGASGVSEVRIASAVVRPSALDECSPDNREFDLVADLSVLPKQSFFISTIGSAGLASFIPPAKLLLSMPPSAAPDPAVFRVPPGLVATSTKWFKHPSKGSALFAWVEARGFAGGEMPLTRTVWHGLFLVNGVGEAQVITRLVETNAFPTCSPVDAEFGGLYDLGGDGDLDILLLGPTPMILERVRGGFRLHAPPTMPCTC